MKSILEEWKAQLISVLGLPHEFLMGPLGLLRLAVHSWGFAVGGAGLVGKSPLTYIQSKGIPQKVLKIVTTLSHLHCLFTKFTTLSRLFAAIFGFHNG